MSAEEEIAVIAQSRRDRTESPGSEKQFSPRRHGDTEKTLEGKEEIAVIARNRAESP